MITSDDGIQEICRISRLCCLLVVILITCPEKDSRRYIHETIMFHERIKQYLLDFPRRETQGEKGVVVAYGAVCDETFLVRVEPERISQSFKYGKMYLPTKTI